jgi:hypothetical protein
MSTSTQRVHHVLEARTNVFRREIEIPLVAVRRGDLGHFLKKELGPFRNKHGKTRVNDGKFIRAYVAFHEIAGSPQEVSGLFVVYQQAVADALRTELKSFWPEYDEKACREAIDADEWPEGYTKL